MEYEPPRNARLFKIAHHFGVGQCPPPSSLRTPAATSSTSFSRQSNPVDESVSPNVLTFAFPRRQVYVSTSPASKRNRRASPQFTFELLIPGGPSCSTASALRRNSSLRCRSCWECSRPSRKLLIRSHKLHPCS